MIKQLEKQLKLNKRKSKSVPKSFASDGLDCILYNLINFNILSFKIILHTLYILRIVFLSLQTYLKIIYMFISERI